MGIFAYAAFYRADPAAFPMTFKQTVSYVWLQQAFLALYMTWFFEGELVEAVVSGAVAYEIARPFDLYGMWFARSCGYRLSRTALRCFPILAVASLLPEPWRMSPPASPASFAAFLLSGALALGVVVAFGMLCYTAIFYTLSNTGVRIFVVSVADFLAGSLVPLPFFPEPFRAIAELLPFGSMQNAPLRVYGGHIAGAELAGTLALQAFWLVALVALGRLWMSRALRRVVVQGG